MGEISTVPTKVRIESEVGGLQTCPAPTALKVEKPIGELCPVPTLVRAEPEICDGLPAPMFHEELLMEPERTQTAEVTMCGGSYENTTNLTNAQEFADKYKHLAEKDAGKTFSEFKVVSESRKSTNPPQWYIRVQTDQGKYSMDCTGDNSEYNSFTECK